MGAGKLYNLEERTALFGEAVIAFAKRVAVTQVTRSLVDQWYVPARASARTTVRRTTRNRRETSATSSGSAARSRGRPSTWLRMIAAAVDDPTLRFDARPLWQEAKELNLIFATIARGRSDDGRT